MPAELTAANLDDFRARWTRAVADAPPARITVDFRHTTFMDSSALGFLVGLAREASAAGRTLRWVAIGGKVAHILALTKLDRIIAEDRCGAEP